MTFLTHCMYLKFVTFTTTFTHQSCVKCMPERPRLYNWWLLNYKLSLFSLSNASFHNSIVRTISVRVNESVRKTVWIYPRLPVSTAPAFMWTELCQPSHCLGGNPILLWRVTADMAGSSEAGPCVNFIVVFYKPSINLRIYTVTFVIQVTFTVYIIVFDFFHFTTLHSTYTTSGPKKLGHCVKCW